VVAGVGGVVAGRAGAGEDGGGAEDRFVVDAGDTGDRDRPGVEEGLAARDGAAGVGGEAGGVGPGVVEGEDDRGERRAGPLLSLEVGASLGLGDWSLELDTRALSFLEKKRCPGFGIRR